MADRDHTYVIVGGGLAGASAVEGIRENDTLGSILLIGRDEHLPYDRPPLTKQLWLGKKQVADIVLHDAAFYERNGVETVLGRSVVQVDRGRHVVVDDRGDEHGYRKLLLATGGTPRRLAVPGAEGDGIWYYRTLDDYTSLRERARPGASALVVGGGFIGSEIAAALSQNGVEVTLLFPDAYVCARVFHPAFGHAVVDLYRERGVRIVALDRPVGIERRGGRFVTRTAVGRELASDVIVAGIGIAPATELAEAAGLALGDGVIVDELLRTSDPDVYAAGDEASFPYVALGKRMRVEHWDNARAQGRQAGRNMAGAYGPYDYMPYFFSDLFELGYEAVGEVDSRLTVVTEWEEENRKGRIWYTRDDRVRGALMCNVWEKVDEARALIRGESRWRPEPERRPAHPNP